ncbi:chain length factor, putative [Babesia ovis]|uniref:Chain length factor, putative n=1 Tax=Babesia ovis TaxID=5869 RepID=A0A9W5WWG8_BABOV|nr:chain length factor, putative [Babesia ovis]
MAHFTPPGSAVHPIPPHTNLFAHQEQEASFRITCPGGVCNTAYYDQILLYTPKTSRGVLKDCLRYLPPIIVLVVLLLCVIWAAKKIRKLHEENERALEQRLIDAMAEEEVHA